MKVRVVNISHALFRSCYKSFILVYLGFSETTKFSSPFLVKQYVYLKLLHLPLHHHLNRETTSTLMKKTTKMK